jgi:hypothetical protein
LLKEPLGVWCLAGLALFATLFYRHPSFNSAWYHEMIVLLPMFIVFGFISSQNGFSIHPRYIIPVLPFLYIFISKTAQLLFPKNLPQRKPLFFFWTTVLTTGCLVWVVVSSLWFYPHSMSYFNELAGKPKNYPQYLLGSNIDWGQDFYELKKYCEKHSEMKPLFITTESRIPLPKLDIQNVNEIPAEPANGWMIISVNILYGKDGKYDWLKEKEPSDRIGYSLWVYQINESHLQK